MQLPNLGVVPELAADVFQLLGEEVWRDVSQSLQKAVLCRRICRKNHETCRELLTEKVWSCHENFGERIRKRGRLCQYRARLGQ